MNAMTDPKNGNLVGWVEMAQKLFGVGKDRTIFREEMNRLV